MITELLNFLSDSNLPNWVIVLLVILIATLFIFKEAIISFLKKKKTAKKFSTENLLQNPIFDHIDFWLKTRINQFDFDYPSKNEIFQDIVRTELNRLKPELISFIKNIPCGGFNEYTKTFIENFLNNVKGEWIQLGIPCYEKVLNDYLEWDSHDFEWLYRSIIKISQSEIYDNDFERVEAVLSLYDTYYEMKILNIESGLKKVNGKYKTLNYKKKVK